jgi:hypothetical protein
MSDTFNMGEEEREPDVFGAVPATDRPPARPSSRAQLQPIPPSGIEIFDGGPSPALREAPISGPIQVEPISGPIRAEEDEERTFDGGGPAM